MNATELKKQNKKLEEVSHLLFGESCRLQLANPADILILKQNARYFKKEVFLQLVDNLKKDERLSSTPLCHENDGRLEVLSGNHRVQAAVAAGIKIIMVMVINGELSKDDKIAVQLSHNALVGEDDKNILADLWAQIESIDAKCYTGLSSDAVGELEKIKMMSFSTPSLKTKQLTFAFTDSEMTEIEAIIGELGSAGDVVYIADISQFEDFFKAIQDAKKKFVVKNGALAVYKLTQAAAELTAKEED